MIKPINNCLGAITGTIIGLLILNLWHFATLTQVKTEYYKARTSQVLLDVYQTHKDACND